MTAKPDYFRSFCKVSRAFGTTLAKERLLDLIVTSAVETMNAKAACLFLADEERDSFVPVAQKGLSDNYLHGNPMQAKRIVKAILKDGYLHIKDATSDPRVENHDLKKAEGIASLLDVPVQVKDKTIGVLALYTGTPRDFTADEIDFLTALAEHGGIAVSHARLVERIRENAALFQKLTASINSSLDIKEVLRILTTDTCRALGMKGASIWLLNPSSGRLELITTFGLSEDFLGKGPDAKEKSIRDALAGETVVISDVAGDARVQYREEKLREGVASMLCAPIKARDEVIGVLHLFSAAKRDYPEETVMLVNALAHTGALAIQNASLYLKLQKDKESLEQDIWSHRSWF